MVSLKRSYRPPKYGNKKVTLDGIEFDSKKEMNRYAELKLLERANEIRNLQTQVKFTLIPAQRIDGKVVERECSYVADFVYNKCSGNCERCEYNANTCRLNLVVEDTKGFKTKDYIIKRKLMLRVHGIRIKEV